METQEQANNVIVTRYENSRIKEVVEETLPNGEPRARIIVSVAEENAPTNGDATAVICGLVGTTTYSVFCAIPEKGMQALQALVGQILKIEVVTASVKDLLEGVSMYNGIESIQYITDSGIRTTSSMTRTFVVGQLGKQSAFDKMKSQLLNGLETGVYIKGEQVQRKKRMTFAEYQAKMAAEQAEQKPFTIPIRDKMDAKKYLNWTDEDFADITDEDGLAYLREQVEEARAEANK